MNTINKVFNFEIKQIGEETDRVLRFVGSDQTPDRDNDIIEVGGWKLDDYLKNPVFLWAHQHDQPPIGKATNVTIDAVEKRLLFDIKFPTSEEYPFADTIYKLYKGGYLRATSVGFRGIKFKTRDDESVLEMPEWRRGRRYMEQALHELSACPVPCNPNALVMAKSAGIEVDEKLFKPEEKEIDVFWTDDAKATDLIAKTREFLKDFSLTPTQIIVDGKEAQVTAKIGPEDSITFGFGFLEGDKKGYVRAMPYDLLVPKQNKKADLEGNPSVWDIMKAVRTAINPTGIYMEGGPWIEDLYPTKYPFGSVIMEKNSKYYLYQYEYEKGIVTLSLNFTELEETYKPKGYSKILETVPVELKEVDLLIDTNTKEVFVTVDGKKTGKVKIAPEYYKQIFEEKSGATLSKKTKEMLTKVCEEMTGCGDRLRKFIDTSGMMEDDPPEDPPEPMMSAMRTAIAEEIKLALEDIKSQVLFVAPKKDATKVNIDLDAIELPEPQTDTAQIELEIEPGQLKEMIKTLIQNSIQGR